MNLIENYLIHNNTQIDIIVNFNQIIFTKMLYKVQFSERRFS